MSSFSVSDAGYQRHLGYFNTFGTKTEGVWSCSLGSGATAMIDADLDGDGKAEIVVGTEMGQVQALDGTPPSASHEKGKIFITDVEESVTALAARPSGNGNDIWVGTVNGKLFVLDAQGKITRRGHLPGLIDHIAVSEDGEVLVTTSGGRVALYPDQNASQP